jgi:hypothetical protein
MRVHAEVKAALLSIMVEAIRIAQRYELPFDYQAGNRPRHIAGNLENPKAVRVIVLLAEPGSRPGPEELRRDESTWLDDVSCDGLGGGGFRLRYDQRAGSAYEKNPRDFLELVWPDATYAGRMTQAIVTNSFWMQAHVSGGPVPAQAAKDFGPYLKTLISLFPNAIVVAAGKKASDRCHWAGIPAIHMGALTPPGSNRAQTRETWKHAAEDIKKRLAVSANYPKG